MYMCYTFICLQNSKRNDHHNRCKQLLNDALIRCVGQLQRRVTQPRLKRGGSITANAIGAQVPGLPPRLLGIQRARS